MKSCATLVLLLCLTTTLLSKAVASEPRPNILYLYVDDMGWGSIGPNAQAKRKADGLPYVKTPNIDRLAAQGVNFTRGYGCHVCSPARSSQQSGFHQGHTFADRNDPDNAKKAMRAEDLLMGDVLSAAGYTTGYWGKWGYGGSKDQENPTIDNLQTLPTSHGYQHVLAELHHVRAHTFLQPTLWAAPAPAGSVGGLFLQPNSMKPFINQAKYPNEPAFQNHADYPEPGYCDDAYAFAALDFVRAGSQEYKKSGKPFFGLFAAQIPHGPFDEIAQLPKWDAAYRKENDFKSHPKQSQQWAAMVTRIDAHFGHLLSALEDPNGDGDQSDSVLADTLVVFQSDNGGPGGTNNKVYDSNGGLKGNKGSIWEGGIRVPLVMSWPSKINEKSELRAGTSIDRIVDVTDLLPTFCELAGGRRPLGIDGVSIAPLLSGNGIQREREFIIHEAGKADASIIRGTHKLVRSGKKNPQLFDLAADHAEATNIAAQHPELVEELHALLLGERVTEPVGFSNTYHQWTGADGSALSKADHWSDYTYANAGITYQTEAGAPSLSWCATMTKGGRAVADSDLAFLGLEIGGGDQAQTLEVGSGRTITGRNEIRVAKNGQLHLDGGTAISLRWVELGPGAKLRGHGTIAAHLHCSDSVLEIEGGGLKIEGTAHLSGLLQIKEIKSAGAILTAKEISGTFTNPNNVVTDENGKRYQMTYQKQSVTLKAL